jgi:hypothetical protein
MCNSGVSYGGACIVVTGEPTNPSRAARLEALNSLDSILTVKGRLAAISSSCKRQGNGPLGGIFATIAKLSDKLVLISSAAGS